MIPQLYWLAGRLADTTSADCGDGKNFCDTGLPNVAATSGQLQTILQVVFGVLTATAVLVIALGGLKYVTSEGNPENTKKARATIIYALVGLVVALSAEAIVSFALGQNK